MQITCSSCQRQLRVPDTAVGKSIRCPGCGTVFKAVAEEEGIQPAKAPVAKRPPPPPPPPLEEYEEVPPQRRPRDEDDDDRPRRRRDEDDHEEEAPRARRRRRDEDMDDDDEDRARDRKEARRRGRSAALWFLLAGIMNLIFIALSVTTNLIIASQVGGVANQGPRMGGLFTCGLIFVGGAISQFTAGSSLRSFDGKSKVVSAIVFGFLFGILTGIGAVVNLVWVSPQVSGFLAVVVLLAIVLGAATSFLNLFAAIKGIVTLNNRAVSRMFRG